MERAPSVDGKPLRRSGLLIRQLDVLPQGLLRGGRHGRAPGYDAGVPRGRVKITNPAKNRYGFGMRGGGGGHQYLMDLLIAYGSPIVVDGKPAIDRDEGDRGGALLLGSLHQVQGRAPERAQRQLPADHGGLQDGSDGDDLASHWIAGRVDGRAQAEPARPPRCARQGPVLRAARVDNLYNGVSNDRNREAAWDWVSFWAEPGPLDRAARGDRLLPSLLQGRATIPASQAILSTCPPSRRSRIRGPAAGSSRGRSLGTKRRHARVPEDPDRRCHARGGGRRHDPRA